MNTNVFLGHAPARIDEKGRIKIPTGFRRILEDSYGTDCFITSMDGEKAVIYPYPVWQELQARLARVPSSSRAKSKLLERVNYYGQMGSLDAQGRLLVPTVLRTEAGIAEDVIVLGNQDHLVVWNEERIQRRLKESPLSDEDWKELELHGV